LKVCVLTRPQFSILGARAFFFGNSEEMLYAYPHSRGRVEGYVGLPAVPCIGHPVYPLKPLRWPSTRMEGQAGTRNWQMHYIGIPDCSSPPSLGPGDFGFDHRVSFLRRAIAPPLLPYCGRRGHTVRPPSSRTLHWSLWAPAQSDQVLRESHLGHISGHVLFRRGGEIFPLFLTSPFFVRA